MRNLYIVRFGELTLKGKNKRFFERILKKNLQKRLGKIPYEIEPLHNRFHLCIEKHYDEEVRKILSSTFGISRFAKALLTEKNKEAIEKAVLATVSNLLDEGAGNTFKIESKRLDKSFPLKSYDICVYFGDFIREHFSSLSVDVHNPDWILYIEIRREALVTANYQQGLRGLPVGAAGKGLVLLSGGIDSPAAAFLMAKRGLEIDAVHYHSYPYTSKESQEKVRNIAKVLSRWDAVFRLYSVALTEIQKKILDKGPEEASTLLMRASMMKIAQMIADRKGHACLITGESLSQVASQTVESIRFTNGIAALPVFRPLIGMDKENIIKVARDIGSYELSIQAADDCCSLVTPEHPLIKPDFDKTMSYFNDLSIENELQTAIEKMEIERLI